MRAIEWRSPEEAEAIDQGPSALVAKHLKSGELASCTSRTLAEHMLQRELTSTELSEWVPELASDFEQSDYAFKRLVREIVTSATYRSIR